MAVGTQVTSSQIDQQITALAVQMRKVMEAVSNLSLNVNGQGNGPAFLEAAGYSETDAAAAQDAISHLNTVAALYHGTAAQPSAFDFNNQLSEFWGGQ